MPSRATDDWRCAMRKAEAKVYPHNLDAERAVLGGVMIEPDALMRLEKVVASGDFYREAHRKIYVAILELRRTGQPLDLVTLSDRLGRKKQLEEVGGMAYLSSLPDAVPVTTNIVTYAQTIREKAILRRLLEVSGEISERVLTGGEDCADLLTFADKGLRSVLKLAEDSAAGSSLLSASQQLEHLARYHELADQARRRGENGLLVETPWPALNKLFGGGWRGGRRPYIIAAQEKVGKTQVMLKAVLYAAERGVRGLIFELELPHIQVVCRMLGLISGISPNRIQSWSGLNDGECRRVLDAMEYYEALPIHIDAKVDKKASGYKAAIATDIQTMKIRYEHLASEGLEPGLVAIDYTQKMTSESTDERQRYIEISEGIADWSTSLSCPVLALAQCLSRGDNQDNLPTARSIFGSSQFAKDACCVIIADRPPLRMKAEQRDRLDHEEKAIAALIVDVEEYGNTGRVEIQHNATCGDWVPIWTGEPQRALFTPQDMPPEYYAGPVPAYEGPSEDDDR